MLRQHMDLNAEASRVNRALKVAKFDPLQEGKLLYLWRNQLKRASWHYRYSPGAFPLHVNPHESVRLARRFLDRYYDTPVTIKQLSSEAALSPFYLIRQFRRTYRQTPHQYLMQQRIARAKELLRTTDMPVTAICIEVGFESLGSFSTLFSKIAGISPSAYRQHVQAVAKPAYIPLCVCLLHGIDETPDPQKEQFSRSKSSTNVLSFRE